MDYAAIFHASPDGILVVDRHGRIRDANPMAETLFGCPRLELLGLTVDDLVPDAARGEHAAHRADYARQRHVRPMGIGMELRARRRDGREFPVEISLSPYAEGEDLLVIVSLRDVTQRAQLRNLGAAAVRAVEAERKRVARELHDDTAQRLAALLIRLRLIERSSEAITDRLAAFRAELSDCAEGVRRIARGLRPPELDTGGLVAALRAHACAIGDGTGLRIDLETDPVDDLLNDERSLVIYRVVQEALANVSRHSGARRAQVRVERLPRAVVVTVIDDGRGFSEGQQSTLGGGLGMIGMHERAAGVGGRVQVTTAPGSGTSVMITVPAIPPRPEEDTQWT